MADQEFLASFAVEKSAAGGTVPAAVQPVNE